ncbi:methyltransferase domain-containing protein [Aquipuribacter nitratireducens]|uniref:Methyltransferase domain-containing protein n=1 Tax=Aquipuribacter nitratireducens TaxID=650104 RepID=A0ABW0GNR2_9MICO
MSRGAGTTDPAFDGALYAAHTAHHRAHDDEVLDAVPWRTGLRVLDVGCGVGDLTRHVADRVAPGGEVLGIDASSSQVAVARDGDAVAGLRFEVARAQELDAVVPDGWADVVLSVATLHWVPETDQALVHRRLATALAPGGLLRIDMGGAGQVAAARAVLDEVAAGHGVAPATWFFPEAEELAGLVRGAGLEPLDVELVRQRRRLPDARAVEGWLRSQVLVGYGRGDVRPEAVEAFAADAVARAVARLRRADGSYDQDYVRARALARRPA